MGDLLAVGGSAGVLLDARPNLLLRLLARFTGSGCTSAATVLARQFSRSALLDSYVLPLSAIPDPDATCLAALARLDARLEPDRDLLAEASRETWRLRSRLDAAP